MKHGWTRNAGKKLKICSTRRRKSNRRSAAIFSPAPVPGDRDLRREVEELLASFDGADSFMESPAAAEVASMFEDKKTLNFQQHDGENRRKICRRNDS